MPTANMQQAKEEEEARHELRSDLKAECECECECECEREQTRRSRTRSGSSSVVGGKSCSKYQLTIVRAACDLISIFRSVIVFHFIIIII